MPPILADAATPDVVPYAWVVVLLGALTAALALLWRSRENTLRSRDADKDRQLADAADREKDYATHREKALDAQISMAQAIREMAGEVRGVCERIDQHERVCTERRSSRGGA